MSNPDSSQRPESLGRLVNILLERKQMDILLTFPYAGLESELEKIVERRARSSDVLSMKLYYSFLYAFHVRQGKMRKAAAVMHEQVLHLCSFLLSVKEEKSKYFILITGTSLWV